MFVVSVPLSRSRDSFLLLPPASVAECNAGRHDNDSRTVGGATGDHFITLITPRLMSSGEHKALVTLSRL